MAPVSLPFCLFLLNSESQVRCTKPKPCTQLLIGMIHDSLILYFAHTPSRLLPTHNNEIQKLSLHCMFGWRGELMPYKAYLEALIPESKYRDTLAIFGYAGEDAIIKTDHRKSVTEVMVKLLWPKMIMLKEVTIFLTLNNGY